MRTAWIVPSRGRPANIVRLAQAWADMGTGADLYVVIDDDDPARDQYVMDHGKTTGYRLVVGKRDRLGPTLNRESRRLIGGYDGIGFMGDDHLPRTMYWDSYMLDALIDGWDVVYGDDLLQHENLPTAVLLSTNVVKAIPGMVPPGMIHLYLDNFWRDLGSALDSLKYLPDVVIEHIHPVAGKAEWDAGYVEVNAEAMYADDKATYERWQAEGGFDAVIARYGQNAGVV